jgi:DNA-binding NarL/FixJ family response regulator
MIRVLVADDHPIVRAGVVGLLDTEPGLHVAGEVASGEAAVEFTQAGPGADVVLMDLRMPGIGGVEATRRILASNPDVHVLVFTTFEDDDQILAAIRAGAGGYLLKAAPAAELIAAIRAVATGQTVLSASIARQLATRPDPGAVTPVLTGRETDILTLVGAGLSNPEIAGRLFIGESTVKTHLLHAFEKLGVSDRTRAVTRAMELGLL